MHQERPWDKMSVKHETSIKICSINVGGLKSKLIIPGFLVFIKQYDIVAIQETKLDNLDTITVEGFKMYHSNRSEIAKYRSGGTAVLIADKKYNTLLKKWTTLVN